MNSFIDGDEYPKSKPDQVLRPPHYIHGGIETIDYIRAVLTNDQLEGYYLGNIIKYISRYKDKGGVQDLDKASVYLGWLKELLSNGSEV